ncbi:hypothetical protein Tco_0957029 [Tanacetum coccineum]
MLVIWNPSIGKSFGIAGHNFLPEVYGFRVFPITKDRTVVNIIQTYNKPWHAEVFTLSSRVWNVIPSSNLPHESIRLDDPKTQVVIDRNSKVLDLPHSLKNKLYRYVCVSKLRESLVVYGSINVDEAECCGVWVMEHDSSFRKLFTIAAPVYYILGFRKSGEPIFETLKEFGESSVDVYDPSSEQIKNLEIYGENSSFFMVSYKESLLLLDHSDSRYELDYWYGFCDAADMVLYWFKSFFDSSQPTGCMLLTFQQYLVSLMAYYVILE